MDPQSKVHLENAGLSEHNKIQNLPNNPPSDGKNSEPRIPIDLVYCLRRGWRTTSRRGKPGKSIVLFQGSPEAAPVNNSVPPTKKRNREEEPVEDDGKRRIPSKKKLIIMEPGASLHQAGRFLKTVVKGLQKAAVRPKARRLLRCPRSSTSAATAAGSSIPILHWVATGRTM
ncbi:UNVERIFIED_CONTAM: hypothetical protein Sradi_6942600 [Sesamum radiatum]|uniref:Uncharacterized protein n=1 Tax=Sesamum radiatum TaxID=300843 RepID=A0AAW2JIH7_SESRA